MDSAGEHRFVVSYAYHISNIASPEHWRESEGTLFWKTTVVWLAPVMPSPADSFHFYHLSVTEVQSHVDDLKRSPVAGESIVHPWSSAFPLESLEEYLNGRRKKG